MTGTIMGIYRLKISLNGWVIILANLDDLIKKYSSLANDKIENTIKETLEDTGKITTKKYIYDRSTVDTGKMRNSMNYTPPTKEGNEWYIDVGSTDTYYTEYQEFGFFNVWARRFIPGVFMVREGAKEGREFLHEELQKRMDVLFKND